MSQPKLPRRPPSDLASRRPQWATWPTTRPMWHIASSSGTYKTSYGQMRAYGPLPTARFDPHPPPPSDSSGERVLHAAQSLPTALAERFQATREIRVHQPAVPVVYSWMATRELRLIDLSKEGALALGASHVITTGPKSVTRQWARAIRDGWPDADGLLYTSSMSGGPRVALWSPAVSSFPALPSFASLLADPSARWVAGLRRAAVQIGYLFYA